MKLIWFIGNYENFKMGTGVMVLVRNYMQLGDGRDLLGIMGIVNIKGDIWKITGLIGIYENY